MLNMCYRYVYIFRASKLNVARYTTVFQPPLLCENLSSVKADGSLNQYIFNVRF